MGRPKLGEMAASTIYTSNITQESTGGYRKAANAGIRLRSAIEFYDHLTQLSGRCSKLVSLGGEGCIRRLEGNKYACLEQGLIPNHSCLVYSFGIGDDLTFEDDLYELSHCDMHVFDPTVILPRNDSSKRTYYSLGLSGGTETATIAEDQSGKLIQYSSLEEIMSRLGHSGRVIHYLKLDVENFEWQALRPLIGSPILDRVGQIGIEIHTMDLPKKNSTQWIPILQERMDILEQLETVHGFRLVSSVYNTFLNGYIQLPGRPSKSPCCMELLYVNRRLWP